MDLGNVLHSCAKSSQCIGCIYALNVAVSFKHTRNMIKDYVTSNIHVGTCIYIYCIYILKLAFSSFTKILVKNILCGINFGLHNRSKIFPIYREKLRYMCEIVILWDQVAMV